MSLKITGPRKNNIFGKIFNYFQGSYCTLCKCWHSQDALLCDACLQRLPWIRARCLRCGYPLPQMSQGCGQCLKLLPSMIQTQALWAYQKPIDKMIYQYKYGQHLCWGKFFGQLMAQRIGWLEKPELILPVPSDRKTLKARGFNQTYFLAKELSMAHGIPMGHQLTCQPKRLSQARLNRQARFKSVIGKYALNGPIAAKRVLIVDDILTTGATISAIVGVLKSAGVEDIQVCVLARTVNF